MIRSVHVVGGGRLIELPAVTAPDDDALYLLELDLLQEGRSA